MVGEWGQSAYKGWVEEDSDGEEDEEDKDKG